MKCSRCGIELEEQPYRPLRKVICDDCLYNDYLEDVMDDIERKEEENNEPTTN